MSHRPQQVASTLRRAIQRTLDRGLSDPRIKGMITITEVNVSPDLSQAVVSVSISPEEKERVTLHGLQSAAEYIQRRAADSLALRRVPKLTFKIDRRIKRERRALAAISLAVNELEQEQEAEQARSAGEGSVKGIEASRRQGDEEDS